MATVRIVGVQMAVSNRMDDNLERILDRIRKEETDFIVFPELALTGNAHDVGESHLEAAWEKIATACRLAYTTVVLGTAAVDDGKRYNQVRIYSDEGDLVGAQDKLVPTEPERDHFQPGGELRTFESFGIRFCCLTGNDCWVAPGFGPYPDPRLSYQLGNKGIDLIFVSAATGAAPSYEAFYESNLRLRAKEARTPIVIANAADSSGNVAAPSGAVSAEGEWVTQCPRHGEHTFAYELEVVA